MSMFNSPPRPSKSSNTFFDEQFSTDLFASFAEMNTGTGPTPSEDIFNDPMACSTPTPTSTSSNNSSTFFSNIIGATSPPRNPPTDALAMNISNDAEQVASVTTRMRESMGKPQILETKDKELTAAIAKPKGKVEKKKKKNNKPTNLKLNAPPPPVHSETAFTQANFEITASGSFIVDDVRISREGITVIPSLSLAHTQSPYKVLDDGEIPTRKSRYMTEEDGSVSNIYATKHNPKYTKSSLSKINPQDLESVRKLGEGASSVVDLVVDHKTGKEYARKIVKLSKNVDSKLVLQEIKALYNCRDCPNILSFFNAYFIDGSVHLLLEYMDGNSLEHLTNIKIPERILEMITFNILKGLYFLHFKKRIVHRDLKPANILVKTNGEVKISDMGLTGIFKKNAEQTEGGKYGLKHEHVWKTCQGTIMYMSPERIEEQPHSYNSDVWSLGITLVELALGRFPFKTGTYFEVMDEVNNVETSNPLANQGFSDVFQDFIYNCLRVKPDDRYSSKDLLYHQFVHKYFNVPPADIAREISEYIKSVMATK